MKYDWSIHSDAVLAQFAANIQSHDMFRRYVWDTSMIAMFPETFSVLASIGRDAINIVDRTREDAECRDTLLDFCRFISIYRKLKGSEILEIERLIPVLEFAPIGESAVKLIGDGLLKRIPIPEIRGFDHWWSDIQQACNPADKHARADAELAWNTALERAARECGAMQLSGASVSYASVCRQFKIEAK